MSVVVRDPSPIGEAAVRRGMAVAAVLIAAFAGLGAQAWKLQVVRGAQFRSQAARQHESMVRQSATRGAILDADGKPLAITADGESIFATPSEVVDVAGTAERLAGILHRDVRELEGILASPKQFSWLARFADGEQIAAVRAAKLPGINVKREPRRWYPASTSIGTVIGFAGIEGEGIDGLELSLNDYLHGQDAVVEALRDARGKTMLANGPTGAVAGSTVRLAVDRTVQDIADAALRDAIEVNKAAAGSVVVLNVKTGQVVAMATAPNYDSNNPADATEREARNRSITDAFELGSVMKLFTVAAAIDAGVTTPTERFNTFGGKWKIGSKTITDVHKDGALTVSEIIKRSSNVGTVQIGLRLGGSRLYDALRMYGFGAPTGIELPGERSGSLRHGKSWREIELATISFGYGLTVTPLQLAAAVAAIGNDGVYQTPHIVADITDAFGQSIYKPSPNPRRVMSSKTAAAMRDMMRMVFEGGELAGTAARSAVPGFVCGGKTGTARKLDQATKSYTVKRYYASFVGLAPIENPVFAIAIVIDDPAGTSYSGGGVAAPVFARIASEALKYWGVPGDASAPKTAASPAPAKAAAAAAAPAAAAQAALAPASAVLATVSGAAGGGGADNAAELGASDEAYDALAGDLLLREPLGEIPNFVGKSMAGALELAARHGVDIAVNGSGVAVAQELQWRDGSPVVNVRFADGQGQISQ